MNLEELVKSEILESVDKEKASQILKAVEGLKIWKLRSYLKRALVLLAACVSVYSMSCVVTTL